MFEGQQNPSRLYRLCDHIRSGQYINNIIMICAHILQPQSGSLAAALEEQYRLTVSFCLGFLLFYIMIYDVSLCGPQEE